jgi:glycosyltransferase involved in cell wall biosynthesis
VTARPRVLLTFLAWAGGLSGGDRHLLEVAARWRESVDIAVLAPRQAQSVVGAFLGDVPHHVLGTSGKRLAGLGPMLALEYLRRALTATVRELPRTDVVVAASHFTPDAAALRALARRGAFGVGYVYHLVGKRTRLDARTVWSKADEGVGLALLRRSAHVVFASNEPTATALAERGFDPVSTAVGIDLGSFRRSTPVSPPQAAFVGRMVRTKGVTDAVRAWAVVCEAVPDARLVMVGAGPERDAGAQLAESLGIADAVEWRGFVSEEEKRQILSKSALFLAPSYEEGWGIAVCEALASGVPVVAYELPVLNELFDSSYLGARVGDTGDLAELATRVLTDEATARTLVDRGLETARRYDVARVAEDELRLILDRLHAGQGR